MAAAAEGLSQLSLWRQSIAPGGATLVLPRDRVHQIVNPGGAPMEILGIFGSTPVITRLPDGQSIELPWRT